MNKIKEKAQLPKKERGLNKRWRLPTLPQMCSTIGAVRLNFSVRNGKRWNPYAIITLNKFNQAEHPYSVLRRVFQPFSPLAYKYANRFAVTRWLAINYASTVTRIFKIPIMIFRSRVIDMLISIMNNVLGLNLFTWLNLPTKIHRIKEFC